MAPKEATDRIKDALRGATRFDASAIRGILLIIGMTVGGLAWVSKQKAEAIDEAVGKAVNHADRELASVKEKLNSVGSDVKYIRERMDRLVERK